MMMDGGGEPHNGGPWHDVHYRKNSRGRGMVLSGPSWCKTSRTKKSDSRGRCFGFVRYVREENMKVTLASMNTVIII
ncbi:hypothetical protein Hanom_Chr03g00214171 [Helianthus anomalus]